MSKTVRINIAVSPEIHEYYKEQSNRAGMSMSAYMSFILFSHMDKDKEQKADK